MCCTFGLMIFHQFTVKKGQRYVLLSSEKLLLYYSRMYLNNKSFCKHTVVWSEVSALGVPLPILPALV